jgi:hypothetical protein
MEANDKKRTKKLFEGKIKVQEAKEVCKTPEVLE